MKAYNGFSPAQRYRALAYHKNQIKAGLKPPKPVCCDGCGQTEGLLSWHSEDYSEPYGDHIGQHGVCYVCHMMIHCRFRNKNAWEAYKQNIAQGLCAPAMHSNNFHQFCHMYLNNWRSVMYEKPKGDKNGFIFELS